MSRSSFSQLVDNNIPSVVYNSRVLMKLYTAFVGEIIYMQFYTSSSYGSTSIYFSLYDTNDTHDSVLSTSS